MGQLSGQFLADAVVAGLIIVPWVVIVAVAVARIECRINADVLYYSQPSMENRSIHFILVYKLINDRLSDQRRFVQMTCNSYQKNVLWL